MNDFLMENVMADIPNVEARITLIFPPGTNTATLIQRDWEGPILVEYGFILHKPWYRRAWECAREIERLLFGKVKGYVPPMPKSG